MKKHTVKRSMSILMAAALLVLITVGSAAAAGTRLFGRLDYISGAPNGPKPLEGAQELIQDDVQSEWTCANGTVQIGEAIYVGKTFTILLRTSFDSSYPELRLLNAEEDLFELSYTQAGAGYDFILAGTVRGDAPETLKVEIEVPLYQDDKVLDPLIIPLELTLSDGETVKLRPINSSEDWTLVDATLTNNPYIAELEVIFQCEKAKGFDMGVDIILLDSEGNRVNGGAGNFMEDVTLEDGSAAYRASQMVQSFDPLPQKVILQPKVIGEDQWLERIECEIIQE